MDIYNFDRIRNEVGRYAFTTPLGTQYEVYFTQIKNIFSYNVAFGVLNEEFEGDDYVMTNRGEVFRVIVTLVEILKAFKIENPHVRHVSFSGEPGKNEPEHVLSKRSRVFLRYAEQLKQDWVSDITVDVNKVVLTFKEKLV